MNRSYTGIDIFKELASQTRLEILQILCNKDCSISQLSKKFQTSIPAIQKHTDRLLLSGLIEKNIKGELCLSPVGQTVLEQVSFFEFLSKNRKYFQEHTFGNLPLRFIHRLGELNNYKFIDNEMQAWEKQRDSIFTTKKFSFGMTTQIPLEAYDIFLKKIKEGVKLRGIVAENTIVTKGHSKLMEKIGLHKKIPKEKMEKRMIDRIRVFIIATDNEGFVSFEDKKRKGADLSSTFYSKDPQFCQWCVDVFNYYWENAQQYDQSKLLER